MASRLTIVSEGAPARTVVLEGDRTRVVVAPAEQFRLLLAEPGAVPPTLRVLRTGNALVVTGLAGERELELSNFFGACRPGRDCALEIGTAGAPAAISVSNDSAPLAALSDGSFLLHGPADGLATLPPAAVPAREPGGSSPWLTGLAALLGLGVAAGAAGGGGGSDEDLPVATLGANAAAPGAPPARPVDTTAPTLAITDGTAAATTSAATTFTFRFSEAVTGFDASDVRVSGGRAGALVAAGDGRTWTMSVTPDPGVQAGQISVDVVAGAAVDASGNASAAVGATQAIDTAAPTLAITDGTAAATTNAATTFTFRFSEAVTGFDASDVRVTGGRAGALVAAGDGRTWTMSVAPDPGVASGQMAVEVSAGRAADPAGNPSAAGSAAQAYDTLAPAQRISVFRVTDNVSPGIGTVAFGGSTNDRTPTITLTLDAALGTDDSLTLSRNGEAIGALGPGATTLTLTEAGLAPGTYAYTAAVADAAGNASALDLNGAIGGAEFSLRVT